LKRGFKTQYFVFWIFLSESEMMYDAFEQDLNMKQISYRCNELEN